MNFLNKKFVEKDKSVQEGKELSEYFLIFLKILSGLVMNFQKMVEFFWFWENWWTYLVEDMKNHLSRLAEADFINWCILTLVGRILTFFLTFFSSPDWAYFFFSSLICLIYCDRILTSLRPKLISSESW